MNRVESKQMRTSKNIHAALFIALLGMGRAYAQDAHFSQYDAAPILLNPALTGQYENADFRMHTNVRSQWNSLASAFFTTAFAYDVQLQNRYGFGTYMSNYNMAGIMNTFQFGVTAAYNVSNGKANHTLSVGTNLGLIYKKVNDNDLIWDAQYSDGYFNSDLPTGEFFERGGRFMPDVGIGVAYRGTNRHKRLNPFGNFALFHVTTPDESIFRAQRSDMPIRWSVNGGARIEVLDETLFLVPMGLYMRQGNDEQINVGLLGEMAIMGSMYSAIAGCSHRVKDAIIAHVGLKHRNAIYRFSYDVNSSPLRTYTRGNGAFEFSVIYLGTHSGREQRRVTSSAF
ncbi:MAG: PorP/SprF family type IX secretion system membrane protein [Flavobacteriales bacterium]|nr:PorP/SprF family type IX secretion system membrane protein [Flavobacteriales bacterium]